MSFETIRIHRDIPIIDGYLQVPPNKDKDKNRLTVAEAESIDPAPGTILRLSGSGRQRGSRHGGQEFYRLSGVPADGSDVPDSDVMDSFR